MGFKEENEFIFDNLNIPDIKNGPLLSSVLHPEDGSEDNEDPFTQGELATVNPKYTISNKLWSYLKSMQKNIESREMDLVMGYLLKMIVQGLFLQDITKMVQKF